MSELPHLRFILLVALWICCHSVQTGHSQSIIPDPEFHYELGIHWIPWNSVDRSTTTKPAWWRSYDVADGGSDSVIVGVSHSSRNGEYLSTKLDSRLEKGKQYLVKIRYKYLSSSKVGLECIPFGLSQKKWGSGSKTFTTTFCIRAPEWKTQREEWSTIETTLIANGEKFFVLGPFDLSGCYLNLDGQSLESRENSVLILFDWVEITPINH